MRISSSRDAQSRELNWAGSHRKKIPDKRKAKDDWSSYVWLSQWWLHMGLDRVEEWATSDLENKFSELIDNAESDVDNISGGE